jgi:hypothetical protein
MLISGYNGLQSEVIVGQALREFGYSLQRIHAPLGHAAPLAASALFACAGLAHSVFLRVLAYGLSSALALLIGVDLVRSFLDQSPSEAGRYGDRAYGSMAWLEVLLAVPLAGVYTFFIFIGLGPWTPFYFVIPAFVVSWLVARRNVRLWYSQSLGYQARLHDAEEREKRHRAYQQWLERHPPEDPLQRM